MHQMSVEAHNKTGPSLMSCEQAALVEPHFMTKWNTPLNVFRICNKGALNTLSNQATTISLVEFSILHRLMQSAMCESRVLVKGCNGAKGKG